MRKDRGGRRAAEEGEEEEEYDYSSMPRNWKTNSGRTQSRIGTRRE